MARLQKVYDVYNSFSDVNRTRRSNFTIMGTNMKTSVILKLAIGLAALAAMPAQAATAINFDDGSNGVLVGSQYAGQGVTFSNAEFTNNFGLSGTSGTLGIRAPGTFQFGSTNAILGLFSSLVSSVSIRGIDVGTAGIRIDAFDSANNLLAFNEFFGGGVGVGTFADISVTATGIARFAVYQPAVGGGDGVLFDNLSFDGVGAVPEPATWLFMLVGMAGIGFTMRRKDKQTLRVRYT